MTATTTYTLKAMQEFYFAATRYMGKCRYLLLRIFYLVGGAAITAVGIYYAIAVLLRGDGDIFSILLAAAGLYLGVQLLYMGCTFYRYFAKRAMRSIPEKSRQNFYRFEENQLVISNRLKSTSYPYDKFGMIYETDDRFLFYINYYNGYVLEKSGLENCTPDEIRIFLNSKRENPVERI